MKILRNHILKELIGPFLFSITVFTFVLLMGNLIKLAELVINKGVNIFDVLKLFFCLIPYLLSYTIPMSILTATLLTFGKLSSDNEITTMRASGISLYSIVLPVIVISLIVSLLSIPLNDRLLPKSHFASRRIVKQIAMLKPTAYLEAGTFIKSFKKYIIFIYGISNNKLHNVRIYEPQENGPTRTIIANKGEFIPLPQKDMIKLKLIDGTSDEPNPKNPHTFYKLNFKTYYLTLDLTQHSTSRIEKKPKDMSIEELREEIRNLKASNIDPLPLISEIYKKIALSFSSFAFIFIGLPLAIKTRRTEKSIGFGLSLMVIIIYYLLQAFGEALSLKGFIHPLLGSWLANILLTTIGGILLYCIGKR
jgi:lipopolysaccharide export system permease protein